MAMRKTLSPFSGERLRLQRAIYTEGGHILPNPWVSVHKDSLGLGLYGTLIICPRLSGKPTVDQFLKSRH